MHSQPRYFVISAPTFDGTTPLDPATLAPKGTNPGGGSNPVPSQNEPRTAATLTVPVGRFSIRSLLRDGRIAALVRVRCITPPSPDDFWQLRSAAVGEQVDPPPINQALLPTKPLTQEWSEVFLAGTTDAISVVHDPEAQVNPQIEIEVSEYSAELASVYLAALAAASKCAACVPGLAETSSSVEDTIPTMPTTFLDVEFVSDTKRVRVEATGSIVLANANDPNPVSVNYWLEVDGLIVPGTFGRIATSVAPDSATLSIAASGVAEVAPGAHLARLVAQGNGDEMGTTRQWVGERSLGVSRWR